jgi:SAM-dependent methyltransferase
MIDINKYKLLDNGSYKSLEFDSPLNIYFDDYWSSNRSHSTIDEQITNVIEKNELVKSNIIDIEPKCILEIACAPGILLGDLSSKYKTFGIEIDNRYKDKIEKYSKDSDLLFGFFPEVTKNLNDGKFSNIIALDVIEHVEDGDSFIKECNRLLVKGGMLIIQAPIILEDGLINDNMFHYIEHIWIYSIKHLTEILNNNGFDVINIDRWKSGHEQITAVKIK